MNSPQDAIKCKCPFSNCGKFSKELWKEPKKGIALAVVVNLVLLMMMFSKITFVSLVFSLLLLYLISGIVVCKVADSASSQLR